MVGGQWLAVVPRALVRAEPWQRVPATAILTSMVRGDDDRIRQATHDAQSPKLDDQRHDRQQPMREDTRASEGATGGREDDGSAGG